MSIISIANSNPTCTIEDVQTFAKANNFILPEGKVNEEAFVLFANSFDAACKFVRELPDYEDPRLKPVAVEGGERKFHRPDAKENPLNAWAHRATLKVPDAKGPLVGRTFAIKDNVSVAGLPLGLGCSPSLLKDAKHPISTIDATVVQRILKAGGTILGTATCENLSLSPLSFSSHNGVVHNAWLHGYATGGSSSGCGALVSIHDVEKARKEGRDSGDYALGEGADMGIGGDQGGSIRLPAAYSGLYGLKPTHGLVPYTGIAPLLPMIDHTGPMTRSVEDAALLLGVIAGYDGIDPRMTPQSPLPSQVPDYLGDLNSWTFRKEQAQQWTPQSSAKGLRIGILKEGFDVPTLNPEVSAKVKQAAERFRSLGAEVKEISIPIHKQGPSIWTVALRSLIPHFLSGNPSHMLSHPLPGLDFSPTDQKYFETLAYRNPAVINVLLNATHMQLKYGPALVRKAHMHIWELRAAYDEALADIDVLITPCNPTVGPKIPDAASKTDENPNGFAERIMDLMEPAIGATMNTCGFNLTGHPGMSIPIGWGKVEGGEGKLPIGMQLVGKRFDEASIFKVAKSWEVGGSWMES